MSTQIDPNTNRTSKACTECKAKKKRCDRAIPKCGYCTKKDLLCTYQTLQKPGLPSGYGASMLDKITRIDRHLTVKSDQVSLDLRSMSTTLQYLESKVLKILDDYVRKRSEEAQTNNNWNGSGQLQVEENGSIEAPNPEALKTTTCAVPSVSLFTELVDIFHVNVYPGFRVIHPSLRAQLIEDYAILLSTDPSGAEVLPHLLGIVYVAAPFIKHRLSEHQFETFRTHCRTTILTKCISITLIEHLQAMALLTFDLFGKSNDPLTWSYIALISAAVIHLGLTKELAESEMCVDSPETLIDGPTPKKPRIITPQSISPLRKTETLFEEECKRNLFWEIFLLDRLSSVSNSFPCKIDETEIERQLPLREDMWTQLMKWEKGRKLSDPDATKQQLNENHDSAAYLVEIVSKLGKIHSFLRKPFDISDVKQVLAWQMKFSELNAEILLWKSQLPETYQTFLDTQQFAMDKELTVKDNLLFSIYHMTIIRLHSSVGYQNFDSDYILFSSMARSKCLESAHNIAAYSKKILVSSAYTKTEPLAICGPYYGFTIWVAARLLLVNAIRLEEDYSADLDQLLLALSRIGSHWRSSAKYKEIIDLLKKEESEYRANGQSVLTVDPSLNMDGNGGDSLLFLHPEGSRLLSDMRFNAYSLELMLAKKIEQYKKDGITLSPHNQADFSNFFKWFQIPINELHGLSTNTFTDLYLS